MATTDEQFRALKIWFGDIQVATDVKAILDAGAHGTLTDRDRAVIKAACDRVGTSKDAGIDLITQLTAGGGTVLDATQSAIKQGCGIRAAAGIITLVNALT